jgi:rhamnosyltransferase subunit B
MPILNAPGEIMQSAKSADRKPKRIVLTTFGSLGDLHPYIAIALGLQARGHEAVIATSAYYRQKIEKLGIGFRPVRPDFPDLDKSPEIMAKIMDLRTGGKYVIREMVMPILGETYRDTLEAAAGADLLVSHILTFTTRLVAEKLCIPWASTYLQPFAHFSAYDPPVLPPAQFLSKLRFLDPWLHRSVFWIAKQAVRSWCKPCHTLRAEIGLPPTSDHPLFEGVRSPLLNLSLFSKELAAEQPDWPMHSVIAGFPFYDQDGDAGMSAELLRFLDAGPPPIVFTLGSSAVMDAGRFYEQSALAAKLLDRRAVLLVGRKPQQHVFALPPGVAAFDYAPFSELFPRAAAIVHQGGIGTTGQAMRSGRPMLVMPYAHDQPDNAARVTRLGIANSIPRSRYSPERAAAALRPLLDDPAYARQAKIVGDKVRQEDGVGVACDALERLL